MSTLLLGLVVILLGSLTGLRDGRDEGCIVGIALGCASSRGFDDGYIEGFPDRPKLGLLDGKVVGITMIVLVGFDEGWLEGFMVLVCVGNIEGS